MNNYFSIFRPLLFVLLTATMSCESDFDLPECDEQKATIMIVPDIQNYTNNVNNFKYMAAIVDYYKVNQDKIDAVFQVGDLTYDNELWQYENAYNYFIRFFNESDQMSYCLGNHDYGSGGYSDSRTSNIQDYMMPYYDFKMEGSTYENYVRYVNLGGKIFGVLVLEFCTRDEALSWADEIIGAEPSLPFIILMHVFLNDYGEMFDYTNHNMNNGGSHKDYWMGGEYKNDSKEIFDKLIFNNPNVKLLVCGHCLTTNYIEVLTCTNIDGKDVNMVMVNYQHYKEGGEGMVGILDIAGDSYRIRSFSSYKKEFTGIDISF